MPVVARWLVDHGLQLDAPDPHGVAHRFRRSDGVTVDLLAPDHVGPRANLSTIPPARTIQAVAGTQLARQTEPVHVAYQVDEGVIQRPSVIATILGKYRAYRRGEGQSGRPAATCTTWSSCSHSSATRGVPRWGFPPATAATSLACPKTSHPTTVPGGRWTTPPTRKLPCV